MFTLDECREHARRYARMAAEIDDPHLKQRFEETAAGWLRVAVDMAKLEKQSMMLREDADKDVA